MSRRSTASLTIAHLTPGPHRLAAPPELAGVEAEVFRSTVAAVSPSHFTGEDMPLLAAYCRACALERRASEELAVAATVGATPSPWLAVHASAVRTLALLSTRLRIGPRSRDPSNRRPAKTGASPSYYDQMMVSR
jgi:phage terminase small subunit